MPPRRSRSSSHPRPRSRRSVLKSIGATLGIGALAGCTQDQACRVPDARGGSGRRGTLGSSYGTGETPDRFYTGEPPSRSGQTIDALNHESLQAAHDVLQPGDTLFIPQSGGPYQDLSISTDHITIDSDGAVVEQQNSGEPALGSPSGNRSRETSLTHPVAGGGYEEDGVSNNVGDSVIYVEDSSSFSPGDDIYIVEQTRPFSEPSSGGARGPSESEEFRTITDVDHGANALHIHHPMFLPYPMENETIVGHIEWAATDVYVSGLHVRGRGGGSGNQAVEFHDVKHGWFGDLHIENAGDDSLAITGCYQCRTDAIEMISGGGYGITIRSGSTHTYCTNSVGDDIMNYTVRVGGSAVDVLAEGVTGRNYKASPAPVCASHWGGFFITYRGVQAEDQLTRYRTREMIIDGFEATECSGIDVVYSQRPFDVILRNGSIGGYPSDANETIFYFRLRGDDSPLGNEASGDVHIENVQIEQLGSHGPADIGSFHQNAIVDGLYIREVYYGGQKLTRQHVEQWNRFGQATINNLVVE